MVSLLASFPILFANAYVVLQGACKSGWYADCDIEEVMKLVNEVDYSFI